MLREDAGRLEVVVLWSRGTVTGWQHVFRSVCDAVEFSASVSRQVADQSVHHE
jgi:hypothetical protein